MDRKQSFYEQKIEVLTRAIKWTFFKRVCPWILSKNRTFSYCFFSQKLCQKRSFFDIYERKQLFFNQILQFQQGPKNEHFLKGLGHGFCPKIESSLMAVFHINYVRKDRFWIF